MSLLTWNMPAILCDSVIAVIIVGTRVHRLRQKLGISFKTALVAKSVATVFVSTKDNLLQAI